MIALVVAGTLAVIVVVAAAAYGLGFRDGLAHYDPQHGLYDSDGAWPDFRNQVYQDWPLIIEHE